MQMSREPVLGRGLKIYWSSKGNIPIKTDVETKVTEGELVRAGILLLYRKMGKFCKHLMVRS